MNRLKALALTALLLAPLGAPGDDKTFKNTIEAAASWCVEDAVAARAAGQPNIAARDEADAAGMRAKPLTASVQARHDDLLPPIRGALQNNPVARQFLEQIEKTVKDNKLFVKGPAGGEARDAGGWAFPSRADQLMGLVQAFCHPQSPLNGDPRLVAPILRRVASISEYLVPGSKILGDFGFSDSFADAWLILRTAHPEILPLGLAARTEAGLKTNAAYIAQTFGQSYLDPSVHYGVVNMDVRRILALAVTERLFASPSYKEFVKGGVHFLSHSVLADGATHYAERQNECFSYHGIVVRTLLRIEQVTGSSEVGNLVQAMRWYYPLSVEPGGVAEWATASSWHHYWNMSTGSESALLMAAVTNCAHNQRIALSTPPKGDLWLASFLRPDLKPAPAPDDYIVYDRNVEGPRGRFGTWSFVGTSRNFGYDGRTPARGKSSCVGAMVTTGSTGNWPLSAALQDVGTAVKVSSNATPVGEIPWIHELVCLTSVESATSAVGEHCAALGSSALLCGYAAKPSVWRQRQAWIFTRERLIGLVTVTAEQDTTAHGVMGTLLLVSGRASWGVRKELIQTGTASYTYGGLAVTIHTHDFAEIAQQTTDVMSGSVTHGTDTPGKSVRLILKDKAAVKDAATRYAKGARHFYLVEIRPVATAPASFVGQKAEGDLLTVDLKDGTGSYRLAYNSGAAPVRWNARGVAGAVIHRSGETYRPAWIGSDGKPSATNPATPWHPGGVDLAGGQLVLIE